MLHELDILTTLATGLIEGAGIAIPPALALLEFRRRRRNEQKRYLRESIASLFRTLRNLDQQAHLLPNPDPQARREVVWDFHVSNLEQLEQIITHGLADLSPTEKAGVRQTLAMQTRWTKRFSCPPGNPAGPNYYRAQYEEWLLNEWLKLPPNPFPPDEDFLSPLTPG